MQQGAPGRPGGASSSVHVPGSAAGQARGPGGAGAGGAPGGGVHLPRSMAPHIAPASAAAGRPAAAPPGRGQAARQTHQAGAVQARGAPPHAEPRRETPPAPLRSYAGPGRSLAPRVAADPRLGGGRMLHTAGVTGAAVVHAGPRPFLRPEDHRDATRDRAFVHTHEADFHTRQVAAFDRHEFHRWQAGLWRNEWHYGRRGWWWDVGGVWYGYPEPIFPYPEEVAPLVVYDAAVIDGPDMADAELGTTQESGAPVLPGQVALAAAAPIQPLPPTPVGWYRCDQPGGYFPGLDSCGTYWALVQNAPMPGE